MNNKLETLLDPLKTDFEKLKMYIKIQKVLGLKKISAIISNPGKNHYSPTEKENLYESALSEFFKSMPNAVR